VQHIVPPELFFEAAIPRLPAIVITELGANGLHFMVVWRVLGQWVQIMDPGSGRRWVTREALMQIMHRHVQHFSPEQLMTWLESSSFVDALVTRAKHVAPASTVDAHVARIRQSNDWRTWASFDTTVRTAWKANGGRRVDETTFQRILQLAETQIRTGGPDVFPEGLWALKTHEGAPTLTGFVFLAAAAPGEPNGKILGDENLTERAIAVALQHKPLNAFHEILVFFRKQALLPALCALIGVVFLSSGSVVEFLLLRAALAASWNIFGTLLQRVVVGVGLVAYFGIMLILETTLSRLLAYLGRSYEAFLRTEILLKTAALGEQYINSRPITDLAQRTHTAYFVNRLPNFIFRSLRQVLDLTLTASAMLFIGLRVGILALVGIAVTLTAFYFGNRIITEVDMRLRVQVGGLMTAFLDALLGRAPVQTHGLEAALRVQQEGRLVSWFETARRRFNLNVASNAVGSFITTIFAVVIVLSYVRTTHDQRALVLLILWTLRLPTQIQGLASRLHLYVPTRNALLRIIEPLRLSGPVSEPAPVVGEPLPLQPTGFQPPVTGVDIHLEGVTVLAGGQPVLRGVDLRIRPGEHIAIVGRSGAGKSTLLSLLLGLYTAQEGKFVMDGQVVSKAVIDRMRKRTAWVDPSIQLWNRSLLYNIRYSAYAEVTRPMAQVLEASELLEVLEKLEEGLRTSLGSNGTRLSGGEGQRVRLARAMFRARTRLVVLDEPFRGLDGATRERMLARTRRLAEGATLLCATHDVNQTVTFDRVLVVEGGRVIEDDSPRVLVRTKSRYRALLEADLKANNAIWEHEWSHYLLKGGLLQEKHEHRA
jgi:ATP-binding cassette subfamily B protein